MKTKILAIVVIFTMVLASFSFCGIKAANGPKDDEYAFLCFGSMTDYRAIYDTGNVDNTAMEGATYDKATNTLTLNNVNTNMALEFNQMGDDFKIKLVGTNSVAFITSYADGHGGSFTITGDGTLNIDTSKFGYTPDPDSDEEMNAITLYAEGTTPTMTVENTATVNIKAFTSVILVSGCENANATNLINLKNGKTVSVKKEKETYTMTDEVNVIIHQITGEPENYDIYRKDGKLYGFEHLGEQLGVRDRVIVYEPHGDYYFFDPEYNGNWDYTMFDSAEEVTAAGYELVEADVTIQGYVYTTEYPIMEDANGKQYMGYMEYDFSTDTTTVTAYDLSDDEIVLSDGVGYKVATLNDQVDGNSLTMKTHKVETGNYDYRVDLKTLNITAGTVNTEIVVEAADENSEVDTSASEEVGKLVEAIISNDEAVEGIDEELAEKIREKVEAGETIYVEVVATEVKAEDIADDVKKVEEAVGTDDKIVSYFNIDIVIKTDDETLGTVTNLQEKIKLTIDVPDDLPAVARGYKRVFKVVRVHDGKAEELPTTVSNGKIEFESDLFSTFALTYEDEKITKNPTTGDNIIIYFASLAVATAGIVATVKSFKKEEE